MAGFLVGVSGLIESIFYLAVSILKIGQACSIVFATSSDYEPIWWFIVYTVLLTVHAKGGWMFWHFMEVCTVITVILLLVYLLGSIPNLDFNRYAVSPEHTGFYDTTEQFMLVLRLPAWFFIGVDLMSLACEEVHEVNIFSVLLY